MKQRIIIFIFLLFAVQVVAQVPKNKTELNNLFIISNGLDETIEYESGRYNTGCYDFIGLSLNDIDKKVFTIRDFAYKKEFGDYVINYSSKGIERWGYISDDDRLYISNFLRCKSNPDKLFTGLRKEYDEQLFTSVISATKDPETVGFISKAKKTGYFQLYDAQYGDECSGGGDIIFDSDGRVISYCGRTYSYNKDNNISKVSWVLKNYITKSETKCSIEILWEGDDLLEMTYSETGGWHSFNKYTFEICKRDNNGFWTERNIYHNSTDNSGKPTPKVPIIHQEREIIIK